MDHSEVIIIGGGPAGSACAGKLRQLNVGCLVLDRAVFPRDKLCAGWITPEVLDDLNTNPSDYPHGIIPLKKMHVTFRGIKFKVPTLQYSIRRYEFDNWLLQRSQAPVITHNVKQIERRNGSFIIDGVYSCNYIVGAGGTTCPVYKTFFNKSGSRLDENLIVTQEEEFPYAYTDPNCYLWFMENKLPGYAWYVPKENGYINVGVGGKGSGLKKQNDTIKRHWDILVRKLEEKGLVTGYDFKPKGHSYYLRNKESKLRRGNAFIIGDAAALATVDMGEGIGPAIRSGIYAAEAIAAGKEYTLDGIANRSIRWKWLRIGK